MAQQQRYSRAPITEAIIDFQVKPIEGVAAAKLERSEVGAHYPEKRKLHVTTGQMQLGEKLATAASSEHVGYRFHSADQKQIVQAQVRGFTFSRLAPYEAWEPFRDEARRLWEAYRATASPQRIERVAVRYVNRLDLPQPVDELKDYLRTSPEISPELPQTLSSFFMHLTLPQPDIRSTLVITETIIEPARPEVVSIVLDIDLFRSEDVPQDEAGIWAFFEEMHARKNAVFEGCITDRTRELIR